MSSPLKLVLILPCHEQDVIGFRGIHGVIPEIVRLPGESMRLMLERTRQVAKGSGSYMLAPVVRQRGAA